jgi:uncharacterized protein (DUF1330 family)
VNRSLTAFIGFLLVLLLAAAYAAWWLGPGVVKLALDESRRNQPYYLLHLGEQGVQGDQYTARFTSLVQAEEGRLLWRGNLERLLEGRLKDEWPDLLLFQMARGGDLVQVITSPEYRQLTSERTLLLLGAPLPPLDLTQSTTLILWLQQTDDPEDGAADQALNRVTANLAQYSASVVWDTPLDVLAGQAQWDHLTLLSFPDEATAQQWFREPASQTERTLATTDMQRQAWLLLQASYLQ